MTEDVRRHSGLVGLELRESGLLGMTRGASEIGGGGRFECGVLGDWYEERGLVVEAVMARGGRPLRALQYYLESRLGAELGVFSVMALVGIARVPERVIREIFPF